MCHVSATMMIMMTVNDVRVVPAGGRNRETGTKRCQLSDTNRNGK